MASPLEELRDRLREEGNYYRRTATIPDPLARMNVSAEVARGNAYLNVADELDKIIESMCDVALKACDPFRNYANPEQAKCLTHNGEIDCKHEWGTLNNDGVTKICVTCSFQPTDNLQPRGE